ncbi:MAG: hypothetical protein KFKLKKLM_01735 [Flavobacteriales bacterium]|nr:hypothetical protein [Flavobacteriales bacterium]
MNKKILFSGFALVLLGFSNQVFSQNIGINGTGAAPAASAGLDVDFTNKGVLIPRVALTATNAAGPIAAPTTSLLVYNTATAGAGATAVTPGYYYWDGAAWVRFSTGGDDWKILGNANTTSGTNFLGTTNAQALDFRTNNTLRFRVANADQVHAMSLGTTALPFYSFSADPNTGLWSSAADRLNFSTNALERLELGTTEAVFNDISADYDFRIASDNQTNVFFVDGGNDRVGIRTAAPSYMFHMTNGAAVVGAAPMASFDNSDGNGVALTSYNISTANAYNGFEGVTNGTYTGCAGIALTTGAGGDGLNGGTNDWQSYGVYGSRFNSGGANTGFGGIFINDLGYTGWFGLASDRRLKKDITQINNALDILTQLNPVKYHLDIEKYPLMGLNTELEYGFIAQEVNEILPEIVREKSLPINGAAKLEAHSENKKIKELFYMMDYTRLIPISIKAIQEQQIIIESQNAKIEALEKIVLELQKAIENK